MAVNTKMYQEMVHLDFLDLMIKIINANNNSVNHF